MESQSAGNSLGKDAWRKLRRSRAAMLSLGWLVLICVLAAITPLLPLQPPDAVNMALQYEEPIATPVWLDDFKLDTEAINETPTEVERLENELVKLETAVQQAEVDFERVSVDSAEYEAAEQKYEEAYQKARQKHAEIEDVIQEPYRKQGFAPLNPLSRWLVRVRYQLFGERSLNSNCGRDELGRDVLSRVFWGARVSLVVGLVATFVSLVIGVTYGAVAGYFGGWVDDAMMRFVDVLYSVPFIFVVIFILTILGEESIARELAYWGI
ncbi:MAG: ABC transporter permease subunit, partial [Lacipirellulaceae bacterium]